MSRKAEHRIHCIEVIPMKPAEITFGITALANAVADPLRDDELALAAAFFTQLGDTLATIAAQRSWCEKRRSPDAAAIPDSPM